MEPKLKQAIDNIMVSILKQTIFLTVEEIPIALGVVAEFCNECAQKAEFAVKEDKGEDPEILT